MKKNKLTPLLLLIIISLVIAGSSRINGTDSLETSLVLLRLVSQEKVIKDEPFFELLDREDYILLPLNLVSRYLKLTITYQREDELLLVGSPLTGKKVEIDLKNSRYVDHLNWSAQAPLIFEGDFYATPLLLEYLCEIKTEWNSQAQQLTLTGNFSPEKDNQPAPLTEKTGDVTEQTGPTVISGPDFALGSIQYRLVGEKRLAALANNPESSSLSQYLYLHGRVKNWAFSLGSRSELLTAHNGFELELIKANYQHNNHLLLLGDSSFDLKKTLGSKKIRGINYRFSNGERSYLLAYTSIRGKAENGARVSLYVNNRLYRRLFIKQGEYSFEHIPLAINQLNTIKVEIINKDGQKLERVKKLVGNPRLYQSGVREIEVLGGVCGDSDGDKWDGQMVGINWQESISDTLSLKLELAGYQDINKPSQSFSYGSNLGLTFRLDRQTILTLDWLVGGIEDQLDQGIESALLYAFDHGYTKFTYYYSPAEVTAVMEREPGQLLKNTNLWNITENWEIKTELEDLTALAWPQFKQREGRVTLTHQKDSRNSTSFQSKMTKQETFFTEQNASYTENIAGKGFALEYRKGRNQLEQSFKTTYLKEEIFLAGALADNYCRDSVSLATELANILKETTFISGMLESIYSREKDIYQGEIELSATLKQELANDHYWSLSGAAQGFKNHIEPQLVIKEASLGTILEYYPSLNQVIELEIKGKKDSFREATYYLTSNLATNYYFPENNGHLYLNLGYVSPVDLRLKPQWSGIIDLRYYLTSNLGIGCEIERLYSNIRDNNPEYILRLSLDQAFGFAGNKIQSRRYEHGPHRSLVSGVVFLDQNNNGLFDQNEKKLAGIKMALNGRRTKTDQDGVFRFEYIRPALYKLGFALEDLDANYTPVDEQKLIRIRENENMFFNFGLTLNGTISGQIFLDQNNNGKFDRTEEPLKLVGLTLNEGERTIYTNYQGSFYLENVPLGQHRLTLLPATLPSAIKAGTEQTYLIEITEDKLDEKLLIPLSYRFIGEKMEYHKKGQ